MYICFFTKHEITWGSSRERIGIYLRYLDQRGHKYKIIYCIPNRVSKAWISGRHSPADCFVSFWHGRLLKYIKFIWIIIMVKRFDVIVIQKVNLLYVLVWFLRLVNKNIIFDFDDLCFSGTSKYLKFYQKFIFWHKGLQDPSVLRLYKKVISGNNYLNDIAARNLGKRKTVVIPTAIDLNLYLPKKDYSVKGTVVIGWAGSGENHLRHLELLVGPLKKLSGACKINFKLIGTMQSQRIKSLFEFLGNSFASVDWASGNELPAIICTFDIGVMPLVNDEEAKGKCSFKVLQYMALGVPVVASGVGVNAQIINSGINGFLADGADEWTEKLSLLISDENLRIKFGKNGRATVEERYSLEKTSRLFLETIEEE